VNRLAAAAAALALAAVSSARDLRVGLDPEVPSLAHAIKLALPGDTIHLEPKVYRDYAGFYGVRGAPGRPIILDGHGATLEGSEPLDPGPWTETAPGHFAAPAAKVLPRADDAVLARWFFLIDGRIVRMGRVSKGRSAPWKAPESLAPGEWTFVPGPDGSPSGTFHLRLPPGRSISAANLALPVRSAGVQFGGANAHLVIRNLTASHPYNDGFNIHGDCRDVRFENIRALGCGDDGISAHESAQYDVDGFTSIGNATGICDTGTARTTYRNVFIADCVGFDLYFLDEGNYRVSDAVVLSSAQHPLSVTARAAAECRLTLRDTWFRRLPGAVASPAHVGPRSILEAERCTFEGLPFRLDGSATWRNCLRDGAPSEPGARGADADSLRHLFPPDDSQP
jgi:hypothetical protein